MKTNSLTIIGYASAAAANKAGCELAPITLKKSPFMQSLPMPWQWQAILQSSLAAAKMDALPEVLNLCAKLAQITYQLTQQKQPFVVIGGDHTCAIGTWSGVAAALNKPLGLLWIDAHMDSHTPKTTHTKNLHGMPLAALLGYGDTQLIHLMKITPKLLPQHVCLIGARSFEAEELALLKKINTRIYFMDEIKHRGLNVVMQEALAIVKNSTAGYGISLDLDVIEPKDAPGVGKPEKNGIPSLQLLQALQQCQGDKKLLGIEIAEFNPTLDKQQKTEKLIPEIIKTIYQ